MLLSRRSQQQQHQLLLAASVLCCCLLAAASAFNDKAFFADLLADAKYGGPDPRTQARTADYYSDTQVACLTQTNFHDCRYTGCLEGGTGADATCGPTNIFLQSDFQCCHKHHSYGYGEDEQSTLDLIGTHNKAGSCDWEISLYRWYNGTEGYPLAPVLTEDGSALKFGTAWGTCYLNAGAEQCDSPLCERMAISIQGGLYVSCAYSPATGSNGGPALEDTCAGGEPDYGYGFNPLGQRTNGGGRSVGKGVGGNIGTKASIMQDVGDSFLGGLVEEVIFGFADEVLGGICSRNGTNTGRFAQPPSASSAKVAAAEPDYEGSHEPLYSGMALIISGPFYETSKHDDKIQETGVFEFAPYFFGSTAVGSSASHNWPVVREQAAKLRFTHEHNNNYGYEGSSSANRRRR